MMNYTNVVWYLVSLLLQLQPNESMPCLLRKTFRIHLSVCLAYLLFASFFHFLSNPHHHVPLCVPAFRLGVLGRTLQLCQ